MSRTKNSIRNVITGLGSQVLVIILKFVTRTVFISTLGKSYLGINGLFSDILTMLSLTELGLDTAINFKLYKPLAEKDDGRIRVLMKFYKSAYTVVGVTVLALGLFIIPFLPNFIKDYASLEELGINAAQIFVLYLMQSASSYLFFAYKSSIVKADQKEYMLNIAGYIISVISNVFQIISLLIWKNFIIYTFVLILFTIIENFVYAVIAQKHYSYVFLHEKEKLDISEVKDILKDLGALFIYKVNGVVLKATDNLVLSSFIGLAIVGMYSNYLMFYSAVKNILNKVYSSVKASTGNLFAIGTDKQKFEFFETMNFISALLYGTAAVGIAVVANELINIWIGPDYIIAQPFSILIGLEIYFVGIKTNLGQIRNVSGAFRQMWFRPVLGVVINLGVSIALVQSLGIYGVLIGTIASDVLTNFLVDPRIIYKYSLNNYKSVSTYYLRNAGYILVLTIVCVLDFMLCRIILPGHGLLSVLVHCLICGCSVPLAFFILFHNKHEWKYLMNKVSPSIIKFKII